MKKYNIIILETKKPRIFETKIAYNLKEYRMDTALLKGKNQMDRKIVSISPKRQITIPQKIFSKLGFTNEAECIVRGNELVIRPARQYAGGEFAEHILAELIEQGLEGSELLKQFKIKQAQVRPAVEAMIVEAEEAAHGSGEYLTYDELFGYTEEKND